jgi:hypothetical protein
MPGIPAIECAGGDAAAGGAGVAGMAGIVWPACGSVAGAALIPGIGWAGIVCPR